MAKLFISVPPRYVSLGRVSPEDQFTPSINFLHNMLIPFKGAGLFSDSRYSLFGVSMGGYMNIPPSSGKLIGSVEINALAF